MLAGQDYVYDAADRHIATHTPNITSPTTSVTYQRDALDRIVQRTETVNGVTTITRYGYTSTGDTADVVLTSTNAVVQKLIPVAGGVLVTKPLTGSTTWSYPDLQGSIIATANGSGVKQGATTIYDPDGNLIGGAIQDNQQGNFDNAWLGGHQRPLEHAPGLRPVIEMGARVYDPVLARFLQVDPIEGGTTTNDYGYVRDPINQTDLTGMGFGGWLKDKAKDVGGAIASPVKAVVGAVVTVAKFSWDHRDSVAFVLAVTATFVACAVCTAAAFAITAVSTYQACSGGDRVGCGVGAVSLATGGAGSALSKVGKVATKAGKARMASKARHLIRRKVTGPALHSAGRSLSRAGRRLNYTSLATSAGSVSYGYMRRY